MIALTVSLCAILLALSFGLLELVPAEAKQRVQQLFSRSTGGDFFASFVYLRHSAEELGFINTNCDKDFLK